MRIIFWSCSDQALHQVYYLPSHWAYETLNQGKPNISLVFPVYRNVVNPVKLIQLLLSRKIIIVSFYNAIVYLLISYTTNISITANVRKSPQNRNNWDQKLLLSGSEFKRCTSCCQIMHCICNWTLIFISASTSNSDTQVTICWSTVFIICSLNCSWVIASWNL